MGSDPMQLNPYRKGVFGPDTDGPEEDDWRLTRSDTPAAGDARRQGGPRREPSGRAHPTPACGALSLQSRRRAFLLLVFGVFRGSSGKPPAATLLPWAHVGGAVWPSVGNCLPTALKQRALSGEEVGVYGRHVQTSENEDDTQTADRRVGRRPASLVVRETQIETTMRCHLTRVRVATTNSSGNSGCW